MAKIINNTYVVTNKVRTSYVHVLEPYGFKGAEPKYSCCIIIPKEDTETLNAIKEACNNAAQSGRGGCFNGSIPKNLTSPIHDGDEERSDREEFKNCYFINAKSKTKTKVVSTTGKLLTSADDVYSGMYVNAVLSFYPYATGGNKGIGCSLGDMQKVEDGERLGGGMPSASAAFGVTIENDSASEADSEMPF